MKNEKISTAMKIISMGRLFAAGGLLSVAVVNVFYDVLSRPLPDSAATWAVWVGGVAVLVGEKVLTVATTT